MKRIVAGLLAAAVMFPAAAGAQIKTLPGESLTVTATVDAIEHASRSLTLRKPDNTVSTIAVPKDYLRFDSLKVGDKVTATYYDNIVIRKKADGEKDVTPRARLRRRGTKPASRSPRSASSPDHHAIARRSRHHQSGRTLEIQLAREDRTHEASQGPATVWTSPGPIPDALDDAPK